MRLYRTAGGQWAGTEAEARTATKREGSARGSWRKAEVPTDKAGLLAFLNHSKVGDSERAPEPAAAPKPAPRPAGNGRWRVFVKGIFACVVLADNDDQAREAAIDQLEVRAS